MSNPARSRIEIRGGANGVTHTRLRRALELVESGEAAWCDDRSAIRMVGKAVPVVSGYWYDRIKRDMRKEELREIPFVGDIDRLNNEAPRPRPAGRKGPVKILTRNGITCVEVAA